MSADDNHLIIDLVDPVEILHQGQCDLPEVISGEATHESKNPVPIEEAQIVKFQIRRRANRFSAAVWMCD